LRPAAGNDRQLIGTVRIPPQTTALDGQLTVDLVDAAGRTATSTLQVHISAAPPTLGEPQGFPGSLRAGPAVNHLHVYSSSAVSLELRVDGRPVAANESYGEQTFLSVDYDLVLPPD